MSDTMESSEQGFMPENVMRGARRLSAIALAGALVLLPTAVARGEDAPIATQDVDALNKVYGQHPGFRANHAKGIVVEGSFKATP